MTRRYVVVDAFTAEPLRGNPVAVILDAAGLDTATMQRIAGWTNLSETTFVLPATEPGAAYQLRIFTPRSELPFAGHPTLGSLHAAIATGLVEPQDSLIQQCAAGLIELRCDPDRYWLRMPEAKSQKPDNASCEALQSALGARFVDPASLRLIDVGPRWLVAQLGSVQELLSLKPDYTRLAALERRLGATGVTLFAPYTEGNATKIEVRSFAPSDGINEDPVCGSGNGAVAAFRYGNAHLAAGAEYTAQQGQCVGRAGQVQVRIDQHGAVWIGGQCVTTADGLLHV